MECCRYDKLIVAVGSVSTTHGVPGLENSYQLKTIADAQAIRRRIAGNERYSDGTRISSTADQYAF